MPDLTPYLYGGLAAVTAESLTFPVDTAKTRLQLQGQTGGCGVRYRGMVHCLSRIVSEEGLVQLYQGLTPALVRQAVYGTIKFGLYYSAKEVVARLLEAEYSILNLGCAVFAGSVSSAVATPTDVIKVRMQARATGGLGGFLTVARDIARSEGVGGLWKGVCPTAQRAALVAGVQLPAYDLVKQRLCRAGAGDGPVCHLVASMTAGLSAAAASNPVDVVRTRLMAQRKFPVSCSETTVLYRSAWHCGLHTVTTEGFPALYKGFVPAFARMGPWNVIFFLVYEKLKCFKV